MTRESDTDETSEPSAQKSTHDDDDTATERSPEDDRHSHHDGASHTDVVVATIENDDGHVNTPRTIDPDSHTVDETADSTQSTVDNPRRFNGHRSTNATAARQETIAVMIFAFAENGYGSRLLSIVHVCSELVGVQLLYTNVLMGCGCPFAHLPCRAVCRLVSEVMRLLSDGVSPNIRELKFPHRTLVHFAADHGQWSVVQVCLDHPACQPHLPDARGAKPMLDHLLHDGA